MTRLSSWMTVLIIVLLCKLCIYAGNEWERWKAERDYRDMERAANGEWNR